MANWKAGTSSDGVGASGCEYDVFLNFRGQDTRYDFTDFLYDHLVDAGVHTFRDEEKLPAGDVISDRLEHAINNSKLYISIFSQNYASSKWCLRELKLIIDNVSKSGDQKSIFPIFLLVKPDDVKLKIQPDSDATYKAAFEEHEKKFPDEVEAWKTALGKVDERKGWVVKEDTSQAAIVKLVVKEVLNKLKIKQKSVTEYLVGIDDRIKELTKFLDVSHNDVRLIGIYGMGGIGKTTIAKVVFNKLCSHFGKCCSFLDSVRERSNKEGIVSLQKQLLSDIGGSGIVGYINNSEEGMRRIRETLSNKKVMVVLDDVDQKRLINDLIGNSKLYPGSRIIVTTRNTSVLEVGGFKGETQQYEMLKMDDDSALQLFEWYALSGDIPLDDGRRRLSRDIVSATGGLPLAIQVIGSFLQGGCNDIWKGTLQKLMNFPKKKIQETLRISYDDLEEHQKQIFLDIACFFVNKNKTNAIYMWTDYGFCTKVEIKVLINRCLIKILDNDDFWMHDQLIALGRHIVRENSPNDPQKHSRLWIAEDALQIIGTKKTKCKVQAIEIRTYGSPIEIRNEDFERLPNLRFLDLRGETYIGDFANHSNLRWFSWVNPYFCADHGMNKLDLDFRASNLYLDKLVVCKLCGFDFKDDSKAWDLIKRPKNLKVLYIAWCSGITTIPNISRCSALERLTLFQCSSLKRIESFIGDLQSLIELNIIDCSNLTDLPKEVGALVKLQCFSLYHCERLRELPDSLGNLTSLTKLDLSGTMIMELPNFILQLNSLEILHFPLWPYNVKEYYGWQLTCGISTLVNLGELDLSSRNRMKCEILVESANLLYIGRPSLEYTRFGGARTINTFHDLHILDLTDCHEIQELPELATSLTYLHLRPTSLPEKPIRSKLTNLVNLLLHDGFDYEGKSKLIPGDLRGVVNLSRLKWVELRLLNVPANPQLTYPSQPQEIVLGHLDSKPFVQLPSSNERWKNLSTLEIYCCEVEDILLDGLPRLENLGVFGCERLQRLSIPLELRKLRQVTVEFCRDLVKIQVVDVSKSLEGLTVVYCESLTIISGLSYLKNLERLKIEYCNVLTNVEGLNELESVKALSICRCWSLRWLIDASCTKIPDDCIVYIWGCGYFIKDSIEDPRPMEGTPLKHYRKEILQNTSKKDSFTIRFHLGVKMLSEGCFGFVGGIEREKEGIDPDSVTYEGLIADVKSFGFRFKRMWCDIEDMQMEILSDGMVNDMLLCASDQEFFIHLYVEGGVDSEWEGEYDEEMMKMLREERRMKTDVYSNEDGTKGDVSCPNEDSNFAPVGGESETHGNSSIHDSELGRGNAECFEAMTSIAEEDLDNVKKQVELHEKPRDEETITLEHYGEEIFLNTLNKTLDGAEFDLSGSNEVPDSASVGENEIDSNSSIDDFRSEPGNTECFEATGNRRQMRDGRIGRCDSIDGGKTASIKNRKKDKDEIGEPANPSDFVGSSGQTCKGVEHYEKSCKATTEVEDQRDFSSVKRDKNVETDRVPTKTGRGSGTGCASNQGRDPTERGRGRGRASSSRNGEGLSLGRDAVSTLGRGTASNSGRYIASSSQSSTTSSLRRDRGSTSGEGTTLTSRRGMTLSLGMGRGSSSRTDTTKMGTTSNPRRGITSSSRSSASLSIGRGRDSTLGEGATASLGRGMTLSLGMGRGSSSRSDTTKMGTASIPGRGITSSSQSGTSLSTGRGRVSTSVEDTTASSRRGKTLSSGRDATKMGTSLRSGTNKQLSSAKAEPQTSRSLEEQ